MRVPVLLMGLLLATAAVTFLPAATAGPEVCIGPLSGECRVVCATIDNELICADRCEFQSDCCSGVNLWCPETEDQ